MSMNVNGLNIPSKRRIIFDHIRKSNADVILLQETHATLASEKLWRHEWGGPAFFSNGSQSSRGVAILVSRDTTFDVLDQKSDDKGCILCMDLQIKGTVYTLCSLYAPTQDKSCEQMDTLSKVEQFLGDLSAVNTIVGGDFNCFLDPCLDRNSSGPIPCHTETYRDTIFSFMDAWNLCDIWRLRNPNKCGYTFGRGNYASRLYFMLISSHLSELVKSSSAKMLPHSDHALVSLVINPSKIQKGPGLWILIPLCWNQKILY